MTATTTKGSYVLCDADDLNAVRVGAMLGGALGRGRTDVARGSRVDGRLSEGT